MSADDHAQDVPGRFRLAVQVDQELVLPPRSSVSFVVLADAAADAAAVVVRGVHGPFPQPRQRRRARLPAHHRQVQAGPRPPIAAAVASSSSSSSSPVSSFFFFLVFRRLSRGGAGVNVGVDSVIGDCIFVIVIIIVVHSSPIVILLLLLLELKGVIIILLPVALVLVHTVHAMDIVASVFTFVVVVVPFDPRNEGTGHRRRRRRLLGLEAFHHHRGSSPRPRSSSSSGRRRRRRSPPSKKGAIVVAAAVVVAVTVCMDADSAVRVVAAAARTWNCCRGRSYSRLRRGDERQSVADGGE
mmetsp:Transcript_28887/g.85356  ORF Transcript_28887/g.85356 Transcript_28887/m.85356 type:complete len:299 (-) Transcript_28887:82-978(-)